MRADASIELGSGHVMRCLTLAEELKRSHADVRFFCREEPGHLIRHIRERGFYVDVLPPGTGQDEELRLIYEIFRAEGQRADWFLIDHYDLSREYEIDIRHVARRLMVIDDLADRRHDCDVLLDQNYHPQHDRYRTLVPEHCTLLLGPEYALLRPQFRKVRQKMSRHYETIKRLFIFMSGSDQENETCKVLRALHTLNWPDVVTDVIIGSSNPHALEIESLAAQIPQVRCYRNVDNMAEFMAQADIGVGAAGSTTWERCCMGLPSVVMILAENQRNNAENLGASRVLLNIGWHTSVNEDEIKHSLERLLQNVEMRAEMGRKGQKIVDGYGALRVANLLIHGEDA